MVVQRGHIYVTGKVNTEAFLQLLEFWDSERAEQEGMQRLEKVEGFHFSL